MCTQSIFAFEARPYAIESPVRCRLRNEPLSSSGASMVDRSPLKCVALSTTYPSTLILTSSSIVNSLLRCLSESPWIETAATAQQSVFCCTSSLQKLVCTVLHEVARLYVSCTLRNYTACRPLGGVAHYSCSAGRIFCFCLILGASS